MSGGGGDGHAGRVVAGLFVCLLGICMVALGGGCTILWLVFGTGGMNGLGPALLALCIALFILGFFVIGRARKMLRPPPLPPAADAETPPPR